MTNSTERSRYRERIYDINGFQVRFFTEDDIQTLTASEGFEICK